MKILKFLLTFIKSLLHNKFTVLPSKKGFFPINYTGTGKKSYKKDYTTKTSTDIDWNNLDSRITPHFTIRECLTYNNKTQIAPIPSKDICDNMVILCEKLEVVRQLCENKPITILSFYRTEEWNAKIGGAKKSLHLQGKAVDFIVNGLSIQQVRDILKLHCEELEVSFYLHETKNFIHIETNKKSDGKYREFEK